MTDLSRIKATLEALRALEAKATKGPWRRVLDERNYAYSVDAPKSYGIPGGVGAVVRARGVGLPSGIGLDNAALIAAARNELPMLLALAQLAIEARDQYVEPDSPGARDWLARFDAIVAHEEDARG